MRNIFLTSAALAALVIAIGCTVSKEDKKLTTLGVPEGSVQVADGTTRQSYTADHSGHVYVYDATSDRLVYQDRVRNGDRLTEIRREIFGDNFPGSALITVTALADPNAKIEIQGYAVIGSR